MINEEMVWQALNEVKDPEIPVVSVVEMGLINSVEIEGNHVVVNMTPTFAGCPALHIMRDEICARLAELGAEATVNFVFDPPWTSDRIQESAREKMKTIGLAPPARHGGLIEVDMLGVVACPYCGSDNTNMESPFGTTICRAIYYCHNCKQSFEKFKAL
ncbi:ring-1,2-phenylacetyl-CoA epoxidase subunit PaaD [Ardenticatena maritima]|uniref:Ring-1,2-phenylacetyl-CoA epoxidase subunit PaaD n=1 Tax=Ardenticatena maritima TaxID=872965 RepID=A0A0M8K8L1_9CHLR|nr:1,2-phenylacetyl-CoA epoxidase subunit PaaD [Ardenticatena maritima]KPL86317.1 hypothetical protein SE16_13380 [Ardenticatena maritima]GAP63041.1 ring-1,2-phenylacetyl-CoA epoxidase subunit PaaD [Ardenticatena maritima]